MVVRHNCRPLRSGSWANSQSRPHGAAISFSIASFERRTVHTLDSP